MSASHRITAERLSAVRASAERFLRETAPQAWAWQLRNGGSFYVPPRWTRLPVDEQARNLAHAEAQRLAEATCWHLDTGCVKAVMREAVSVVPRGYRLTRDDLPSAAGFLVWAEPISPDNYVAPVIAVHWRVEDDGVWTAWWTDKASALPALADAHGVTIGQMRDVLRDYGDLLYDRERLLPYGHGTALEAPPDAEQEAAVTGMTAVTLATWTLLHEDRFTLREVDSSTFAASLPTETTSASART
jgi:hypothetical protein